MGREWFVSAVLAVAGITVFGHFEEKTPLWRRLSKWAFYFGVTRRCRVSRVDSGRSPGS
jgi:hypothetical protein